MSIPEKKWNRENVLSLIKEYKSKLCLWDPKDKYYKIGGKKNEAWDEISVSLDCDVDVIRKKMNSLLTSFRRERRRGNKANYKMHRNRYNKKKKHKPRWFAFDHMSFLLSKFISKGARITAKKEIEEPPVVIDDDEDEDDEFVTNTSKIVEQNDFEASKEQNSSNVAKRIKLDIEAPSPKMEVLTNDETSPKCSVGKFDDCAVYGEHVACKLRCYPNHTKNIVQHYINNILFKADMGKYDTTYDSLDNNEERK